MHKKSLLLTLSVLLVFILTACGQADVVATVNGEKITNTELSQQFEEAKAEIEKQGWIDLNGETGREYLEIIRQQTLENMINNKLLLQEAKKYGKLTKEQIQDKIDSVKAEFPSEEQFKQFLTYNNLSEEDFAYIVNLQEQLSQEVPSVSAEEVRKYYDENPDQFQHQEQMQVRHILFFVDDGTSGAQVRHTDAEARQMAEEVITLLGQGEDFAALAVARSEDSGTGSNGGLYTFSAGQAVQEFEDAAAALAVGDYTRTPVKTQFGYHVIKMEQKIEAGAYTFDEIKNNIEEELNQTAISDKLNKHMQEVKNNAQITNKLAEEASGS